MANYYYLGRKPYAPIFGWMTASLIFAVCGILAAMASKGKLEKNLTLRENLQEEIDSYRRLQDGTNLEPALKAVQFYRANAGAADVWDKFEAQFITDGNYSRAYLRAVKKMLKPAEKNSAAATDADIEKFLRAVHVEGLTSRITHQEQMINFYTQVVDGFKDDSYKSMLKQHAGEIPLNVIQLLERQDGFDPHVGAKAYKKALDGDINNLDVLLGEAKNKEVDAMAKSMNKRLEQEKVFKTLKGEFFSKAENRKNTLWQGMDQQNKIWSKFITTTQNAVEQSRIVELQLHKKKYELESLEKIYADKIGPVWVPPLDLVDGEILTGDRGSKIVLINIGRSNGLTMGQGFNVFRMKGKVLHESKGRVVVSSISNYMSVCKVLEEDPFNPITSGDVIADGDKDTHFDRKVPPKYVLSGEFDKYPGRGMITVMITNAGGVLYSAIQKDLDYMVVGDRHQPEDIEAARQFGVRVIHGRKLAEHLGYTKEELVEFSSQFVKF